MKDRGSYYYEKHMMNSQYIINGNVTEKRISNEFQR